ncbi:MAG: right-handed parallel beta-helix repeat-containing protein [Thermoplasmata archaeon]|nr:MAG: right-handed parallel beta-helix repeat-containing protein [Thermoplasmata archaeon]
MRKKRFSSIIICLLIIITFFSMVNINFRLIQPAGGATIYVGGSGPDNKSTIQEGIIAADPGDTVFVYNGTYTENVDVNKMIKLIGEDKNSTIINGGGSGDAVIINADWVNVSGFKMTGGGPITGDSGIELNNVGNCKVSGNIVSSNGLYGIYLISSNWNDIIGNSASNNYYGMCVRSSNNNYIYDNKVNSNSDEGIVLDISNWNNITCNAVLGNTRDGICLVSSSNNDIYGNNVTGYGWYGIFIWDNSDGNYIFGNIASGGEHGVLFFEYCNNNDVIGNTISDNDYGIDFMDSNCIGNRVYHNNIIENVWQGSDATDNGNQWHNGYPSGGNYWSDFDDPGEGAFDEFKGGNQNILGYDGIVDQGLPSGGKNPYLIGNSQDQYPLIKPFGLPTSENFMMLKQGWNLISIPLIQQDQSLIKVLEFIDGDYDAVQWYDPRDSFDPWKHYKVGKSYGNDLLELNESMGFWVHITQPGDTIFFYNGTRLTENQNFALHPGWNMVGYPSLSNKIRTEALNNIDFPSDVDAIWTYNSTTQKYEKISESDYFEIGRGYYIHAKAEVVWEVPL